jgi:hypothetical protein
MDAIKKIDALGVKRLHGLVVSVRPGVALETVYRWRTAISDGSGVSDSVKRALIASTVDTLEALSWDDFCPSDLRGGNTEVLRLARAS